ncbi:type VI secretion system protein TssA [Sphingomonas sp. DT-51]|uniref:type VI secretion system protein TssA n=1 Tax=Sphingomonas sp. DT-51 TaxID=3396165 RepID=UPI003F1D7A7D
MTFDLDTLLSPVSDADPAGPDLAYSPQRHEIEQAFEASVSIDTSGAPPEAVDVDWRRIVAAIAEQSTRTKDVWLAVYLCRAGARWGKLDVVETGAGYLAGLIERFWNEVHPRLDEYGVEGRTGACDTLASFREFLAPLKAMTLLTHPRHGSFSGHDLHRFQRGGETEQGYGAFRAALDESGASERLAAAVSTLDAIDARFRAVDDALAERAGSGAGVSFAPVYQTLAEIRDAGCAFLPGPGPADADGDATTNGAETTDARRIAATIRSREDVIRAIDLIVDYYTRSEPQSPVPLLLGRAREWVNRDFIELLQDIVPQAVGEARLLLNFRGSDG